MTKRIRTTVIAALCAVLLACVGLGAWLLRSSAAEAEAAPAQNVGYSTVAVHDPSIVVAYEGADGKTYPTAEAAQAAGGRLISLKRSIMSSGRRSRRRSRTTLSTGRRLKAI